LLISGLMRVPATATPRTTTMQKLFTALAFIAIGTITSACQPDARADIGHAAFTERLATFNENCGLKFGPTTDGFKNCVAAAFANDPEMGARIVKEIATKKASNLDTRSLTARIEQTTKDCGNSGLFPAAALACFRAAYATDPELGATMAAAGVRF
jgi:hypothetical protein